LIGNYQNDIYKIMILRNNLILVVFVFFFTIQITAQTKVIAHRGFSGIAPENTLKAFQEAIDSGADYFELDVHKTFDDKLYVIHDGFVSRTCSNHWKGNISEMYSEDVEKVRVGYPEKFGEQFKDEKIPTLKEALELAKGKIKVCIEIKVYSIEEEVLKIINELDMKEEVIIFSFHYPVLTKIRDLDKTIPILYIENNVDETVIGYAKLLNVNGIGVGYGTIVTKELLDHAHKNGIEIWEWTVNDEVEIQQLMELGIDGLITNHPDMALEIRDKENNKKR